jgi:hypothetical protein
MNKINKKREINVKVFFTLKKTLLIWKNIKQYPILKKIILNDF